MGSVLDADDVSALRVRLEHLAAELVGAVPCCVALHLTIERRNGVAVVSLLDAAGPPDRELRSSLLIHLPDGPDAMALVAQADQHNAFDGLHGDLLTLVGRDGARALLDGHLQPVDPDSGEVLADAFALAQAVGVLIGQGWLPEQAQTEIDRRAGRSGISAPAAARLILLDVIDRPAD